MNILNVKILRPGAKLPQRATESSAGYDLHACVEAPVVIPPGERRTVPTGIAVELPDREMAAFVFGRSGLGIRHGIVPSNAVGVVDSDYRGEILVGLSNLSDTAYTVEPGERIAQMVILPVLLLQVAEAEQLSGTQRGAGGFGSTGRA